MRTQPDAELLLPFETGAVPAHAGLGGRNDERSEDDDESKSRTDLALAMRPFTPRVEAPERADAWGYPHRRSGDGSSADLRRDCDA